MLANFRFYLTLSCLFALAIEITLAADEPCSNEENAVWSSDGQDCILHRNECHFRNANKQRQDNGAKLLAIETKEECQRHCPLICSAIYIPTCAEYNGEYNEFANSCTLYSHMCYSGKAYRYIGGPCPGSNANNVASLGL